MSTSATESAAKSNDNRAARIEKILRAALQPSLFELRDESHLHAGHNETAATSGETHYRLTIASAHFNDLSRVAQHRMINELLQKEFDNGLHALALTTKSEPQQ